MRRRTLLLSSGIAGAGVATGLGFWRWQEIDGHASHVRYPGRDLGHRLRDASARDWPSPSATVETDVLIAGSGIAGLTAAWRLAKEGHARFVLVDGPEPHGNAASGIASIAGERLRYPTGAHYLPLPTRESTHVREMLEDLGVIVDGASTDRPTYDERAIVHAPEERLFRDGRWHEGLLPIDDDDHEGRDAAPAIERFVAFVDRLRETRGRDGRRVFAIPIALSSTDPAWTALDAMSFATWLDREGHVDAALRWYLDHCCRDDYGADAAHVSAWAGLHYFASRNGRASNAERGAVLTWPEGLDALATRLEASAFAARPGVDEAKAPVRLDGLVLSLVDRGREVEAVCARIDGTAVSTYVVRARRAICAMPLFVARRVVAALAHSRGDDTASIAPWLVANFVMRRAPAEADGAGLAWDNVVFGSTGLGYVVSTHQELRVAPSVPMVLTAYRAMSDRAPLDARRWLDRATPAELGDLAVEDLRTVYGWRLAPCVERVDIAVRAHAMSSPRPGFLVDPDRDALRAADGAILYAHADLSGLSIFEESAWWGWQAAGRILGTSVGADIASSSAGR